MSTMRYSKDEEANDKKAGFPYKPVFFLTFTFYLSFLARIILSPLMPKLELDLGIGHGDAGSLFLLVSLGHVLMLFNSGFVSSLITHNKTIAMSSVAAGIALFIISQSHSLFFVRFGLVLLGVATGLYLPSGLSTLTEMVEVARWGRAVAIHELATNLAFFTAPLIAEGLMDTVGWRGVFGVIGGFSVVIGFTYFVFRGGRFSGEVPTIKILGEIVSEPVLWVMVILISLGIGANFGVYSMLPLFLVSEKGLGREVANNLVSFSRPIGLLVVFVAGWAADHFGRWRTIAIIMLGSGFMTLLLGVVPKDYITPIIFLHPVWAVAFFPPAFAALSGLTTSRLRGMFSSLALSMAILLGTGVVPFAIGIAADLGFFPMSISLLGVLNMIAGGVLGFLVQRNGGILLRQVN